MKTIVATAALMMALAHPASAELMITQSCVGGNCAMVIGPAGGGLGRVIRVEPPMDPEAPDRILKWAEFCQARIVRDRFNVPRYTYARVGCEYGRDGVTEGGLP